MRTRVRCDELDVRPHITKSRPSCWVFLCATFLNKRYKYAFEANVSREPPGMDYATIVDDAVRQFYSAGSNEAHSWLLQVQTSPEAWHFVWQLLDPSKVSTSARIQSVLSSFPFILQNFWSIFLIYVSHATHWDDLGTLQLKLNDALNFKVIVVRERVGNIVRQVFCFIE